jgi:hypothetical protein
MQATVERTSRLLSAEVEQELGGGKEERGAPGKDGSMGEILGDHGLAQSSGGDEHDVAYPLEEVEREQGLDQRAIDLGGPIPIEVGHRLEFLQARARHSTLQAAASAVLLFEVGTGVGGVLVRARRRALLHGGGRDGVGAEPGR